MIEKKVFLYQLTKAKPLIINFILLNEKLHLKSKSVQAIAFVEHMKLICENNKWHDPVDNPMLCLYTQNGNYRPRYNTFGKVRKERSNINHQGVDLLALPDSNVYACVDGEIVRAGDSKGGYGNVITLKVNDSTYFKNRKQDFTFKYKDEGELEHGPNFNDNGDFYVFYAHLNSINVKVGDSVKVGDIIGKNGTSGYGKTKDPHLHFEILNRSRAGGLKNRVHPRYYCYYKMEEDLSQTEKDYQKQIASKYWD